MALLSKITAYGRIIRWKIGEKKRDIDFKPAGARNPKFMSARQAVGLIPDGAVCMSSGMASNMRPTILYFAVRDVFEATGHPKGITWISAGGMGGRGRVAGTVEEVGQKGLCNRFISGHLETARSMLKGGEEGYIELHTLPQGIVTLLAQAQGQGIDSLTSPVGIGTFIDPRVGKGSPITPDAKDNFVTVDGDELRYRLPPITAACVMATEADEDGNIYMRESSLYTEVKEACLAAKANGGITIVAVAKIIPKSPAEIFLPADKVDAIVVCPRNEQTLTVPQLERWDMFLPGAKVDVAKALAQLKPINDIIKLDPVRGPIETAMARSAAAVFARVGHPGCHVINGYGLPQEVGRLVMEGGLARDVNFLIETGAYGGIPAPGLFFGTAINPERLITSAEMFTFCRDNLDVTVLGMLQADSLGNVNVSKKSDRIRDYVGPGGFIDLVTAAKNIVFIGNFQARAKLAIEGGKMRVIEPGIAKFVDHVDEITFYGPAAVARGQHVYYATPLGLFQLTSRGLTLIEVMPGVDVRRDILDQSQAKIVLPEDGKVAVAPESYLTGSGFRLAWKV